MSYRTILWIVGGLTVINILLLVLSYWQKSPILNFVHFIFTSVAVSIIYGMYYEVIEQRYSSIKEIFSKFSAGYLVLSFLIFIPVIIFMIIATIIKPLEQYYLLLKDILTVATVLLTIYVVPYYYISNNIVSSILKGINFNIKNIYFTSPIICLVFLFEIIKVLIQDYLFVIFTYSKVLYFCIQSVLILAAYLNDFFVFIVLILVLKNRNICHKTNL